MGTDIGTSPGSAPTGSGDEGGTARVQREPTVVRRSGVTFSMSHYPATTTEPLQEISVGTMLRAVAARSPESLALTEGTDDDRRTWTYGQLLDACERLARELLRRFEPNERVAVWGHNLPEWVVLEYACALAGVTLVTVNPTFRPAELRYVLEQSAASGVIAASTYRDQRLLHIAETVAGEVPSVRAVMALEGVCDLADADAGDDPVVLPDVSPEAIAQIQFTSGTTGRPKLFEHPSVGEVAVIGMADDRLGETVVAVLRLVAGESTPSAAELRAWCRETLAPFKTPSQWFAVEHFPATASGKIKKFELPDLVSAGQLRRLG